MSVEFVERDGALNENLISKYFNDLSKNEQCKNIDKATRNFFYVISWILIIINLLNIIYNIYQSYIDY